MRTIAWETAFQIVLRNCSKEAAGKGQCGCDFDERGKHAIKHCGIFFFFLQKVSASQEKQSSP